MTPESSLETKSVGRKAFADPAANFVGTKAKVRAFAKRLTARLPWGMRKVVAFVGNYGPLNLLMNKPSFVGVYRSFADAPPGRPADNRYLVHGAALNLRAQKSDAASGLPILRNSHSLLPLAVSLLQAGGPIRILDIGGAGGVDFANLLQALPRVSDIRYRVVELEDLCEFGNRQWEHDPRISFTGSMPSPGEEFDLVYSSWAIQYFPEPLAFLEKLTTYQARAILLINAPLTAKGAFVRMQVNKMIPSWVLSLSEVERVMRDRGYALSFHVAADIDHNVDNYPPEHRVSNLANLLFLRS